MFKRIRKLKYEKYYKKNKTTYFYWETKKGKRTGKLLSTNDLNKISQVLVYPQEKPDILNMENILFFSVEYDWYYREIFVFFYYPEYKKEWKGSPFLTNKEAISIDFCSLLYCVMEGELYNVHTPTKNKLKSYLEPLIPAPMVKYVIKELFRMQSGSMSFKPNRRILYNPKTIYDCDLLYNCLIEPFVDCAWFREIHHLDDAQ